MYIKCPETYDFQGNVPSIFLAGGISNCPNWQTIAYEKLKNLHAVIINPRRDNFGSTDSSDQIKWEYYHLHNSDIILFWFPSNTVCPITLFELGKMISLNKKIYVGADPQYSRRIDIIHQLHLSCPKVTIHNSLDSTIDDLISSLS